MGEMIFSTKVASCLFSGASEYESGQPVSTPCYFYSSNIGYPFFLLTSTLTGTR